MKLFLTALLSLLSYRFCSGYPVEDKLSKGLLENEATMESWFNRSNDTASNHSSPVGMHNFDKKFFSKLKVYLKMVQEILKMKFGLVQHGLDFSDNGTSIQSGFNASTEIAYNDSSPLDMHGFGKKVVEKVKEGIKTVKDKVKGGFDKVKNKIKDFKDKIGSKGGGGGSGGGSGGGYYRDKYDRDYDRDRYDRDIYDRDYYRKDIDSSGGSGTSDPNAKWFGLAIGIFMIVGIAIILIYYKVKGDI